MTKKILKIEGLRQRMALGMLAAGVWLALAGDADAESLWMKGEVQGGSMFCDKRARGVGDLLTIVVTETSTQTNAVKTKTSKDTSIDDTVTKFVFSDFLKRQGELPGIQTEGKNSYEAGGEISNRHALNARVTVRVIDVLPNGVLVIEGSRVVTFAGETTYAILRGLVRPNDVTPVNTVSSDRVADARVEYVAEGALTEVQKKGWFTKANDVINPF